MPDSVRDHLIRCLDWEEAHVSFDKAVAGVPADKRGARASGFEHSPWELIEHLRIGQEDLLDFCINAKYVHEKKWPDDYWPKTPAPANDKAWSEGIAAFVRSRDRVKQHVRDVSDLTASVPTGNDTQTHLRTILLIIDHAAYHVGQIVAVRRALGAWP